jgi:hypothetical protein
MHFEQEGNKANEGQNAAEKQFHHTPTLLLGGEERRRGAFVWFWAQWPGRCPGWYETDRWPERSGVPEELEPKFAHEKAGNVQVFLESARRGFRRILARVLLVIGVRIWRELRAGRRLYLP